LNRDGMRGRKVNNPDENGRRGRKAALRVHGLCCGGEGSKVLRGGHQMKIKEDTRNKVFVAR